MEEEELSLVGSERETERERGGCCWMQDAYNKYGFADLLIQSWEARSWGGRDSRRS